MTGIEAQLAVEQQVVDGLYARLDELRAQTRERLAEVRRVGPSGSPQNRSERDAFATLYEDRLARLEAVEDRLAFGRLDLAEGGRRYIGRIGLNDDEHASMLTDWRAPAAQSFYRATSARPDGVVQRRHLVTRGRRVTGLEDEVLDLDVLADAEAAEALGALSGEGALLAALAARRTGRMGDIVATIQAEQDAIIRAELAGALVVQGGPGTGKTAVALHRAAYLLYAHPGPWSARASCCSGRAAPSCGTSTRCSPPSARPAWCPRRSPSCTPASWRTARRTTRSPRSRAAWCGAGSSSARSASGSACPSSRRP